MNPLFPGPMEKAKHFLDHAYDGRNDPKPGAPPYNGMVNTDWASMCVQAAVDEVERLKKWLYLIGDLPDEKLADRKRMVREAIEGFPLP